MKKILIVSPKQSIEHLVKDYLKNNVGLDGLSFASCEFVTTSTDDFIHLRKDGTKYLINDAETEAFVDLALQSVNFEDGKYAVSVSPIRTKDINLDVDYVLFVMTALEFNVLSALEFCERNEIPENKAFINVIPSLANDGLKYIFDLSKIAPLFETARKIQF